MAGTESQVPAGGGDALLVERLREGDQAAYETLVREQTPILLAVTRRFLRNEEDAQDAVQEAFVSAFRSLGSFGEGSRISTWLHRIAVNAALMKLRTRRRKPEESIDDLLPSYLEDGHRAGNHSAWTEQADVLLERREARDQVRSAIEELPETYRTVLLLRDIEGLDTDHAARALDVSANAVKVRLHRARQALRTLLDRRFREAAG
jgi:RNA polymerase sigma-70 factor (ECF subfamily)